MRGVRNSGVSLHQRRVALDPLKALRRLQRIRRIIETPHGENI